ncbi:MAG: MFS transporter [Bacteroidota bacterium]
MSIKFQLSSLQFFQNAAFAATILTVGTYLLQSLNFSGRQVGMIYATNALAATVMPLVVGWLADRHFPANRLLVVLNLVATAALGGCFFATSFPLFYTLILLFNLSFIPTFALLNAVCFHALDNPSTEFPAVRVWGTISFVLVGLALSGLGIEDSPWPLALGAVLALLMGLSSLTLPQIPPQPGFRLSDLRGPEVQAIFREPGMVVLFVAMLISCLPSAFYYSFVNPFLNEVGWENAAAKMVLGQIVEIFVVLALPFVFRKLRFRQIVFWGLFLWGARYFAFAAGRPQFLEWLLYLGILAQGFVFAWVVIAGQIYVDNRVPKALRSTAQGLISFANQGVGIFVGSWIAGEVVSANAGVLGLHDWDLIWLVPGVVGVLGALYFWVFFPKAGRL